MWRVVLVVCGTVIVAGAVPGARDDAASVHAQRVLEVQRVPGLAAFWDFVTREPGSPQSDSRAAGIVVARP